MGRPRGDPVLLRREERDRVRACMDPRSAERPSRALRAASQRRRRGSALQAGPPQAGGVRALRWDGIRLTLVRDLPDPVPAPGEAVVRVHRAGICRTDLEITRGYLGFRGTPGHEWVGHVVAAPDPDLVGARVVGEINLACGVCPTCAAGLARHCPMRRVLGIVGADGAFADQVVLPARNLHRVPDRVSDAAAAFVAPLAAAFEVLEQVMVAPGMRAVVLGDGKLGLLVAQVLMVAGARVVLAGHHAEKLVRARQLGIATGPPEVGADLVVDTTGSPGGLAAALSAVRPRGTIVLKTTVAGEHRLDLAPAVINEVTVVGPRCGPFAPAVAALTDGRISVAPLVDAVYPLDDAVAAFARAAEPGVLKVQIEAGG